MRLRQSIHIEGKCIEDIFNLPCIVSIHKKNNSYCYHLTNGQIAHLGDWLCEDYGGNWSVLSDEQYKLLAL